MVRIGAALLLPRVLCPVSSMLLYIGQDGCLQKKGIRSYAIGSIGGEPNARLIVERMAVHKKARKVGRKDRVSETLSVALSGEGVLRHYGSLRRNS